MSALLVVIHVPASVCLGQWFHNGEVAFLTCTALHGKEDAESAIVS